jgi:NADPH:quinone reductase
VKNIAGVFHASLPRVPGRDYAGVVIAGEGWVGKEVWGSGAGFGITRDGTHAQYVAADLNSLSEKPSHLSMADAAAVGVPYLAAWSALAAADIQPGETVLVAGALGAVGRAATQIAHWKKARVIGADIIGGTSEADILLNTREGGLAAQVRGLTEGRGADLVLDTVGGPMFEPCLQSLRIGGRQVAIASMGSGRVEFSLVDFYHRSQRLIGVDTMKFTGHQIAKTMNDLRLGFEDGHLRISALQTWSLDQAIDAYNAVGSGDGTKKHIILPRQS